MFLSLTINAESIVVIVPGHVPFKIELLVIPAEPSTQFSGIASLGQHIGGSTDDGGQVGQGRHQDLPWHEDGERPIVAYPGEEGFDDIHHASALAQRYHPQDAVEVDGERERPSRPDVEYPSVVGTIIEHQFMVLAILDQLRI